MLPERDDAVVRMADVQAMRWCTALARRGRNRGTQCRPDRQLLHGSKQRWSAAALR
ncbi:hypothetical protein M6B38_406695 [Iris pallida]|uniref:Uncharacterized protein n=1 Tax=Iris pallida TaxID=29817 RepID=A0AAX6FRJ1_IRIPA|nr:hypothetical protein M6B38_406695 [Iris pallida]